MLLLIAAAWSGGQTAAGPGGPAGMALAPRHLALLAYLQYDRAADGEQLAPTG